ncbi:hypothetical protein V8E54_009295 [Elaphomyces granulatus]
MKLAAQSVLSLSLFVAAVRSQSTSTITVTPTQLPQPLFTYCRCVNSELHWANSATESLCNTYDGQTEYDSIGTCTCEGTVFSGSLSLDIWGLLCVGELNSGASARCWD